MKTELHKLLDWKICGWLWVLVTLAFMLIACSNNSMNTLKIITNTHWNDRPSLSIEYQILYQSSGDLITQRKYIDELISIVKQDKGIAKYIAAKALIHITTNTDGIKLITQELVDALAKHCLIVSWPFEAHKLGLEIPIQALLADRDILEMDYTNFIDSRWYEYPVECVMGVIFEDTFLRLSKDYYGRFLLQDLDDDILKDEHSGWIIHKSKVILDGKLISESNSGARHDVIILRDQLSKPDLLGKHEYIVEVILKAPNGMTSKVTQKYPFLVYDESEVGI